MSEDRVLLERGEAMRLNGNRVAVKIEETGKTAGGLIMVGSTGPRVGVVVAVSSRYPTAFGMVDSPFAVGDRLMIDELGGLPVEIDGEKVLIVRHEDVIGTL
jgi:co-chaperonin GroES (HSP10)